MRLSEECEQYSDKSPPTYLENSEPGQHFIRAQEFASLAIIHYELVKIPSFAIIKRKLSKSYKDNNNFPNLIWYDNSNNEVLNLTSPYAIPNNEWHHVLSYKGHKVELQLA